MHNPKLEMLHSSEQMARLHYELTGVVTDEVLFEPPAQKSWDDLPEDIQIIKVESMKRMLTELSAPMCVFLPADSLMETDIAEFKKHLATVTLQPLVFIPSDVTALVGCPHCKQPLVRQVAAEYEGATDGR